MSDRPSIVFILTDDQGYWTLGCYGNSELRTPNLDRLAGRGMRFDRFFCTSPVCSPARATIVTGRIPSQHGVHDWLRAGNTPLEKDGTGRLIEYLAGQPGTTDYLASAGYRCGISGKWHLGDSHRVQKSFDYWEVHAKGGGPYYNAPMVHQDGEAYTEPRYVTDAITDNALTFLEDAGSGTDPFYLSVHYTAPHSPWGREQHPDDLYDDYHQNCPFDSVPRDVPRADWITFRSIPVDDEERRRHHLAGYFAAVERMDHNVGRILDRLDAMGLAENTIVCFTSDNGMNMGHHGVFGKGNATFPLNMYEESVRVPFLLAWPARVAAGQTSAELLNHFDIMPTLLDCAGITNPDAGDLPGVSFLPILTGDAESVRSEVIAYEEYGPVRMVRTREWKYVHRYPYGPHELYDLVADPGETTNRVDDPECAKPRRDLRSRLDTWFQRYVDPARDGTREASSGSGQIDLAGPAAEGRPNYAIPRYLERQRRQQAKGG